MCSVITYSTMTGAEGALTPVGPLTSVRLQERKMAAENPTTKHCNKCGADKPLAAFYTSPKGRTDSYCRECISMYRVDYYERNRSQIKARRGPYNIDYARRRRQDPETRAKSIASIRAWWQSLSPSERKRRNQRKKLLKRYGLTIEQWEAMRDSQNGLCAICEQPPSKERDFHVDHCHQTGRVRGLLCVRCNTSLAWFERVQGRVGRVMKYLEQP